MRNVVFFLLLAAVALLGATSCKMAETRPGASCYVDLQSLVFTVESVEGQVQIKPDRNSPWRDLIPGDTFNGYALIRSGFQSSAKLMMEQGHNRSLRCELGDLVCAISINDVYDRVLSPEAIASYNQNLWKKDLRFDPGAPILISREALSRFKQESGLLADADGTSLYKRKTDPKASTSGTPGLPGGGGGGAGGGGGGGCAT